MEPELSINKKTELSTWVASTADIEPKCSSVKVPQQVEQDPSSPANTTQVPQQVEQPLSPANTTQVPQQVEQDPSSPANTTQVPQEVEQDPILPANTTQVPQQVEQDPLSPASTTQVPQQVEQDPSSPASTTQVPQQVEQDPLSPASTTQEVPQQVEQDPLSPTNTTQVPQQVEQDPLLPASTTQVPQQVEQDPSLPASTTQVPQQVEQDPLSPTNTTQVPQQVEQDPLLPASTTQQVEQDPSLPASTTQVPQQVEQDPLSPASTTQVPQQVEQDPVNATHNLAQKGEIDSSQLVNPELESSNPINSSQDPMKVKLSSSQSITLDPLQQQNTVQSELQTPVGAELNPSQPIQTPVQAELNPSQPIQTPVQAELNPSQPIQTPVQAELNPSQPMQTPVQAELNPSQPIQTPVQAELNPSQPIQTPVKAELNPSQPMQTPVQAELNPSQPIQTPVQAELNPSQPMQTPMQAELNPSQLIQPPVQAELDPLQPMPVQAEQDTLQLIQNPVQAELNNSQPTVQVLHSMESLRQDSPPQDPVVQSELGLSQPARLNPALSGIDSLHHMQQGYTLSVDSQNPIMTSLKFLVKLEQNPLQQPKQDLEMMDLEDIGFSRANNMLSTTLPPSASEESVRWTGSINPGSYCVEGKEKSLCLLESDNELEDEDNIELSNSEEQCRDDTYEAKIHCTTTELVFYDSDLMEPLLKRQKLASDDCGHLDQAEETTPSDQNRALKEGTDSRIIQPASSDQITPNYEDISSDGYSTVFQRLPTESAREHALIPNVPPCRNQFLQLHSNDREDPPPDDGMGGGGTTLLQLNESIIQHEPQEPPKTSTVSLLDLDNQLVPEENWNLSCANQSLYAADSETNKPAIVFNQTLDKTVALHSPKDTETDSLPVHCCFGLAASQKTLEKCVVKPGLVNFNKPRLRLGLSKKQKCRSLHIDK